MSQDLSSLIDSLRTATARDSVTPELVAAVFTAMRDEYEQRFAEAASGGEVNLQSINDAIDALESALNSHKQEASDSLAALNKYAKQTDNSLDARIRFLENVVSDTPQVVNAPAILHFKQVIGFPGSITVSSPIVQQSTSAPWYPVYYAPENTFAARLASNTPGSALAPGEKLYGGNVVPLYNSSNGTARTDMIFACGNDIFMHNGDALVRLTNNETSTQ